MMYVILVCRYRGTDSQTVTFIQLGTSDWKWTCRSPWSNSHTPRTNFVNDGDTANVRQKWSNLCSICTPNSTAATTHNHYKIPRHLME